MLMTEYSAALQDLPAPKLFAKLLPSAERRNQHQSHILPILPSLDKTSNQELTSAKSTRPSTATTLLQVITTQPMAKPDSRIQQLTLLTRQEDMALRMTQFMEIVFKTTISRLLREFTPHPVTIRHLKPTRAQFHSSQAHSRQRASQWPILEAP